MIESTASKSTGLIWTVLCLVLMGIVWSYLFKHFLSDTPETSGLPVLGITTNFQLTDQTGTAFERDKDLSTKVWIASFIFTRCEGPCPAVSSEMAKLESQIHPSDDIQLVSFTVDPDYDRPGILKAYAEHYSKKDRIWHFLTGPSDILQKLFREDFKVTSEPSGESNHSIMHSTHLVLIDSMGRVRGYFDSSDASRMNQLLGDAHKLVRIQRYLPTLNALLNSTCTVLLILALRAVRKRQLALHKKWMLLALFVSAFFLMSYLTYHLGLHLTKKYEAPYRHLYLTILISHTLLAIGVLPLILMAVWRALKAESEYPNLDEASRSGAMLSHRKMVRWAYPIWLYVSVTGVVVYLFLYQLPKWLM